MLPSDKSVELQFFVASSVIPVSEGRELGKPPVERVLRVLIIHTLKARIPPILLVSFGQPIKEYYQIRIDVLKRDSFMHD